VDLNYRRQHYDIQVPEFRIKPLSALIPGMEDARDANPGPTMTFGVILSQTTATRMSLYFIVRNIGHKPVKY
jgi:hypothetical protein